MTTSKVMKVICYKFSNQCHNQNIIYLELFHFPFFIYSVAVYDCNCDSDESLIVKACGITNPLPITSSSNSLRIVFKTDALRNATGFKAVWSTENIKSINSPDYPLYYPRFTDVVIM